MFQHRMSVSATKFVTFLQTLQRGKEAVLKRPSEDAEAHVTHMECFLGDVDLFLSKASEAKCAKAEDGNAVACEDMKMHVILYKVSWFTSNTALIAQESSSPADVRAAAARAEGQEVTDLPSVRI